MNECVVSNDFLILIPDYSKAFDTHDHTIMCKNLWFSFFFFKGIVVDGIVSVNLPVSRGVPQGSILALLLFTLYINDFH